MGDIKSYLKLHFVVLIWGFTAILGLLITLPAVELVFYRTLFAAIGLGILLYFRKRNFKIGWGEILKIVGTGVLISAHWILFFASARVSNASVALAGIATCSFWTSFLEPLMTKRKIKGFEVLLGVVVVLGLYVIFRFEFTHAVGLSMAIVSALLASLFTVINSQFTQRHNPYMITFYEMGGAFITTAVFLPFYALFFTEGQLQLQPTTMDWVWIIILAIVCTVYAYSLSVELMQKISAFMVNLTVNMEPVYGIILAVLIFGESEEMQGGFYLGTLIILLSVIAHPFLDKWHYRKQISKAEVL
ncbi:EamA family transporter [Cytophagales bacterium LB-30]|uniref:EamA family transporter n=1 Tax=Shiella aurantiaca TaxID=3058365 RepID=A0ABT8F8H7_9BACT|nr:EamA family transporter [Shiella aurantiaca]MDN4166554.1 EamA family transporter [Shiella aurantiaca]